MDTLTIFTIALSIASFILAVISVITVIVTIRQNNRMLEASTRSCISIYFDYTNMGELIGYFIIKNFGNSSAKITSITYNDVVKAQPTSLSKVTDVLNGLIGNTISPGQKILIPINVNDSPDGTCIFNIAYCTDTKIYKEQFEIIVKQYCKFTKSRITGGKDKLISYPLQEIVERLM